MFFYFCVLIKRVSAHLFYRLINKISDVEIPEGIGDFRLLSRRVVDVLNQLPESNRFMKGLFSWVGFRLFDPDYPVWRRECKWGVWHGSVAFCLAVLRTVWGVLNQFCVFEDRFLVVKIFKIPFLFVQFH